MIFARLSLSAGAIASLVLITGCQTASTWSRNTDTAAEPAPTTVPARKETVAKEEPSKKSAEGEVVGTPASGSRFSKVQLGMGMKEVTDLIGQPTDQGAYITGKAWVPFYFGADRYRHELLYKGVGRLVFAGGGMGNLGSGRLIRIMHNADERGYR